MYWFYTECHRSTSTDRVLYESGVFTGSFVDLILMIREQDETDKYYDDFKLICWKEISFDEKKELEGYLLSD